VSVRIANEELTGWVNDMIWN